MKVSAVVGPVRAALAAACLMAAPVAAGAAGDVLPAGPDWPDSPMARLAALALVQSLNADLLSNPSATLTLDRWCADHGLAPSGAKVVAERAEGQDVPAGPEVRKALGIDADEPVRYRRVRLRCGTQTLSEADNWYVPALLTADMNKTLETTDTAFGRVVKPLGFRRQTQSAHLLWHPLPQGWEMDAAMPDAGAGGGRLDVPPFVLEHRAVLTLPDGRPFSMVTERYTRALLAFPLPRGL